MTDSQDIPTNPRFQDLTGQTFGRLAVLRFSHTKNGKAYWICRCACGGRAVTISSQLRAGHTQSCGCTRRETAHAGHNRKHGLSRTKEYMAYHYMLQRCYNPKHKSFKDYGGRGISVCVRWLESFDNFLSDMGLAPTPKHQIDRTENGRGYGPDNCRWATPLENTRHRRNTLSLTHEGQTKTLAEWAEITGLPYRVLNDRLHKGWPAERIVTQPLRAQKRGLKVHVFT